MASKLTQLYLILTLCLGTGSIGCTSAASAENVDDTPVVVLRSDDIRGSWALNYLPTELGGKTPLEYGKEKRIPVTWGTIVNVIGAKNYLTSAQLNDYLSVAGGEIASHSVTHSAMPNSAAYIKELVDSKNTLKQLFPLYFKDGFIQPGYWLNDGNLNTWPNLYNEIGGALRANYKWSGDYLYTAKKMGGVHYPYGMCTDYAIDYAAGVTADSVTTMLNEIAKVPGMVFIFTCHGIQPSTGTGGDVRADVMEAFMNTAAELRDQGKIHFLSQSDSITHPFPSNINCVPNGGFESDLYWWTIYNGASTSSTVHSGQKAVDLNSVKISKDPDPIKYSEPGVGMTMSIKPGKYSLNWYQRVENSATSSLEVKVQQYIAGRQMPFDPLANPRYRCSAVGQWEPKQAFLVVNDGFPKTILTLQATGVAHYLADDVSLRLLELNSAKSPTEAAAMAKAESCELTWKSPSDIASIVIRVGNRTHPVSPTDGTFFAQVNAIPGSKQSISKAIDWSQYPYGAYFSIFAVNGSEYAQPDVAIASEPQALGYIRSKKENALVILNGAAVSASFADSFYIESVDRTYGIRVEKASHGLSAGMSAGITGTIKTDANGERYILATNAIKDGYASVSPVSMGLKSLGGISAKSQLQSGVSAQGVSGGEGPYNIGLLVKTWGVVTSEGDPFTISDGSKALVSVSVPATSISPKKGDYVVVTGISSCLKNQSTGEITRLIRATKVEPGKN